MGGLVGWRCGLVGGDSDMGAKLMHKGTGIGVVGRDVRASAAGVRPSRGRVALVNGDGVVRGESAAPLEMLYLRGPVAVAARHFHSAVNVRREWSPNIRLTVMNWVRGEAGASAAGRADRGAARGPEMKLRLTSPPAHAAGPVARASAAMTAEAMAGRAVWPAAGGGAESMAGRLLRRLRRAEAEEVRPGAGAPRRSAAAAPAPPAMAHRRVVAAAAASTAPPPPARPPDAAPPPPPPPPAPPDVNRLTEQVIQGIDRRLRAERERYGRV